MAGNSWAPMEISPFDVGAEATAEGLVGFLADKAKVDELLVSNKAIVFRDFGVTPETLDPVLDGALPNRLAYVQGNTPRTKVGDNVYTSTEYPAEYSISMHNELSYAHAWPARLMFFCQQAAQTGGATPVIDGVRWLESLDPKIREAFADGVCYRQNLHGGRGFGKSWQETFETDDKAAAEDHLAQAGAVWEWRPDGSLRVSQLRPSTIQHPVTGEEVWFNQSDQWHPASLGEDTAAALAQILPEEDLPQYVTFADGSPIPDEYVIQIRDRGLEEAVDVDWRAGDLLLIDNILVGHGRRPFTGPRRVLVAMSD
jgi:alpha-ketoglutarate-dependent taurine dioxygenase